MVLAAWCVASPAAAEPRRRSGGGRRAVFMQDWVWLDQVSEMCRRVDYRVYW